MKKGKLIAWIVWIFLGIGLVIGLFRLLQTLLISGTQAIDNLGKWMIEESEEADFPESTNDQSVTFSADDFDGEPEEAAEPETLIRIPVEETIEELARENADRQANGE